MAPLAIDLYAGLGGWTEGLLAEGYRVVGFDNTRHVYGAARYQAQLVIQDVLTLHGSQFKDAALIVASPPCQEFSYMAMPWTRAKEKAQALRDGRDDPKRLTALFDACFRIQREACEAAGHHIPLVVENVCGAQKWVGRARWHYGSFYLWGDVPALMPIARKHVKVQTMGAGWYPPDRATKNDGGSWFAVAHNTTSGHGQNPDRRVYKQISEAHRLKSPAQGYGQATSDGRKHGGVKHHGSGAVWFDTGPASHSSKSNARKAASAHIAKIPLTLARHIASAWYSVV